MSQLQPKNEAPIPVERAVPVPVVPDFESVAKEVLKKSIRSAVCIDDKYASAYSFNEEDNGLNFEEPARIYSTFREEGLCDVDIYQFKSIEDSWKHHMSHNKDLLILDWELDPGEGYDSTLLILEDVINSNKIPFVVIYTNTEDLHTVGRALLATFNGSSEERFKADCNNAERAFRNFSSEKEHIDCMTTFESIEKDLYEYLFHYKSRGEKEKVLIQSLADSFKIMPEHQEKFVKVFQGLFGKGGEDPWLELAGCVANRSNRTNSIKRIEIEPHAYKVDGTIILIYHKASGGEKDWQVKPEDLFSTLSTALTNNPHSFLNLLALEFKERLRENFSSIGSQFASINEAAFIHHMSNYRTEEKFNLRYIYDFILKSWIGELHNQKLNEQSEVLNLLEERYQNLKGALPTPIKEENVVFLKELVKYSAFISNSDLKSRMDVELRFGDLFIHNQEYFLCITPHCDCAVPEKISNNFYFVRGLMAADYESLKNAETGFYSFINFKSKPVSIQWKPKPFTAYIKTNDISNLTIDYCGVSKKLTHVTVLKENYTQRIANQAFGYGYRVGIDLPHIKEQKDQDSSATCSVV